jgi:transaldolase
MTNPLNRLKIKLFVDGADEESVNALVTQAHIAGMTTNPSLIRKAGGKDYEAFARKILEKVTTKPISFEVFSDEFDDMTRQALKISSWAKNVYTKIPVTNTRGEFTYDVIRDLAGRGVKLNITAILTREQVRGTCQALNPAVPSIVSVFAGRIADTGVDPVPAMRENQATVAALPNAELLWASTREVLNIFQAEACGCAIITVPAEILAKAVKIAGISLPDMSLDTVKDFAKDAAAAGFRL